MDVGIPPIMIRNLPESNPLKSRFLVRGLTLSERRLPRCRKARQPVEVSAWSERTTSYVELKRLPYPEPTKQDIVGVFCLHDCSHLPICFSYLVQSYTEAPRIVCRSRRKNESRNSVCTIAHHHFLTSPKSLYTIAERNESRNSVYTMVKYRHHHNVPTRWRPQGATAATRPAGGLRLLTTTMSIIIISIYTYIAIYIYIYNTIYTHICIHLSLSLSYVYI